MSEQRILENGKIVIFMDDRESADMIEKLKRYDVAIKQIRIEIGDFVLSNRVGIERKKAADFARSIIDGRLFEQARKLSENFKSPILLVEGEIDSTGFNMNALSGAIISLIVDFGIPIIFTKTEAESASWLVKIAEREQRERKNPVSIKSGKKPKGLIELQEYIVASLPGVGAKTAKKMLRHFNSVEKIFNASEGELAKAGLGAKKARKIRKLLTGKYE